MLALMQVLIRSGETLGMGVEGGMEDKLVTRDDGASEYQMEDLRGLTKHDEKVEQVLTFQSCPCR